jgi:hypothetical protein
MKTTIINDKSREVLVVKAGHRREVYRWRRRYKGNDPFLPFSKSGWIEHRINIRAQKIG